MRFGRCEFNDGKAELQEGCRNGQRGGRGETIVRNIIKITVLYYLH